MSRRVDKARAADRKADRLGRLEKVLTDLARVTKLQREGLPMDVVAERMGWDRSTLYRWLQAAKLVERKGLKMSQGNTTS